MTRAEAIEKALRVLLDAVAEYDATGITGDAQALWDARHAARQALALPADEWRAIESAPHNQKILVGYRNELGNWRTITACYCAAGTLEIYEDSYETDDGFAPEGWYEESETHEDLLRCPEPTHWRPLPAPPKL